MDIRKSNKVLRSMAAAAVFLGGSSLAFADRLPEESFALARMAIEEAQEVDADAYSSSELTMAETKLQEAIENDDRGREEVARRLLKQSMLHAELAEVEGLQAQADESYTAINAALVSLEAEARRQ
jgi:osmotically-inducible protein OsmY